MNLNPEQIKRIAGELDCGFDCYVDKTTSEYISIPNEFKHPEMDHEVWEPQMERVRRHPKNYLLIEPPESRDAFRIMADFAESPDLPKPLRTSLINALNRRHPFSNFKYEIDNSGEWRQKWFDFKAKKLEEWVEESIKPLDFPDDE